jgi:CheY-like chemotaxis protein
MEPEQKGSNKHRIMVVDDEPAITYMMKTRLKQEGYDVSVARNGMECLDKIRACKPDMVLLDIMMPGMDGLEVCRRIKEDVSTSNVKVGLVSVRADSLTSESLRTHRADFGIKKPVRFRALCRSIEEHLQGRKY